MSMLCYLSFIYKYTIPDVFKTDSTCIEIFMNHEMLNKLT